jgi:hypothetical protein
VLPLIPSLLGERVRSFAEPCCGDGSLVRHLESHGLRCLYAGDIASGQDALLRDDYGGADVIITNPPHTWAWLRPLISHFQRIAPTWLLHTMDWASNEYAEPFLPACTDIVSIRRVQWIPGTKHKSMENFGWYRFDARHTSGPVFHGRNRPPLRQRAATCIQCSAAFQLRRSDSRFCSNACRQRAYRERLSVTQP